MTDRAEGENAKVVMIKNFENTERWEDKTGNTQQWAIASWHCLHFFIFTPHFPAFTNNKLLVYPFECFTLSPFDKMLGSCYPEFVDINVFMGIHETINNNKENSKH